MGLLRRGRDTDEARFRMRERMISIGDDYWIEDDSGEKRFRVNGKVMRVRDTWVLEDAAGREVAQIREKKLSIRDSITIEVGDTQATVKKALIGIRERYHVEIDGGTDLKVGGNIVDHEYEIERDGDTIGTVSKRWFRVRDTYGVAVKDRRGRSARAGGDGRRRCPQSRLSEVGAVARSAVSA